MANSGEFLASLKRVTRNDENDCVVALTTDAQQIEEVPKVVSKETKTKTSFICDVCGADFGTQITMEKHKVTHK